MRDELDVLVKELTTSRDEALEQLETAKASSDEMTKANKELEQQIATVFNDLKEKNEKATDLAAQLKEEASMKASPLRSIEIQKE